MAESIVRILSANEAAAVWAQIKPLIERAIALEGLYSVENILVHHARNEMQIWVSFNGAEIEAVMITQIDIYPLKKVCHVRYVAGRNLRNWCHKFIAASEDFARAMGCVHMYGGHRKGWARVAGYRIVGPMLVKDLQ